MTASLSSFLSQNTDPLPARSRDRHKNTSGRLGVLAGSDQMPGAALLCSRAALRSGVGRVMLSSSRAAQDLCLSQLPEVTLHPELTWIKQADAHLIGPGLSQDPKVTTRFKTLMDNPPGPLVIDADALNLLSVLPLFEMTPPTILSPHWGEMARLSGHGIEEIEKNTADICRQEAAKRKAVVVLKSHQTWISDGKHSVVFEDGSPALAKAGSGDVLAGLLGGFLCQGMSAWDSACWAVALHGQAGALFEKRFGERPMLMAELDQCLRDVITQNEKSNS